MKDVAGKVAFVTGGSSGIGLGITRAFAEAGMKVVIGYQTKTHLNEAMRHLQHARERVHAVQVDVTDRLGMLRAAEETVHVFGRVHVLVSNAGVVQHTLFTDTTYDDWDWTMSVNLGGVFNGLRAFLSHILSHGEGGHLVATSSILGLFTVPRSAAYVASKYAVVGLMESLRAEMIDANVGVSVFCPGMVTSNIMDANRSRPSHLGETHFKPDAQQRAQEKALRSDPEINMDALEAGRVVLRGMRNNDLYILSHPEYEQIIQDRHEALMASIPRELKPTARRLEMARAFSNNIYAAERSRKANSKKAAG